MMYIGTDGVYTYTFEHEKRPECPVCGGEVMDVEVKSGWTLQELIDWLLERQDVYVVSISSKGIFSSPFHRQIKKPSLATSTKQLYLQAPPQLEKATRPNLDKKLSDLIESGAEVTVTSTSLPFSLSLRLSKLDFACPLRGISRPCAYSTTWNVDLQYPLNVHINV